MRKLIMKMSITVDGFVGDLNGKTDWVFRSSDDNSLAWSVGQTKEAGLIIMGRKSFQNMGPYWPTATGPFAAPMNEIPKAVFTEKGFTPASLYSSQPSPTEVSWAGARVFDGDLAEGIKTIKAESGKPIVAIGGAGFMRSLISTGLIDEYHLATHPIMLGSGLPVFPELAKPLDLKLVDVKTFPKGIVVRIYHPA
jgi:dihydrofolate reductase